MTPRAEALGETVRLRYSGPRFEDHGLSVRDLTAALRGYAGVVREVAKSMGLRPPAIEVMSIRREGQEYEIELVVRG